MQVLMLLVWLVGSQPHSEVLFFDNYSSCMDFGNARMARLKEQHEDVQFLVGECLETELQKS